ncbi:MAG TPA: 16S rRNA (cytosine(1402)-N(4))-methyltransferase, partial [Saprospiraceae bacterium]|nr:16S rRNA (cytosine(1402)-N(4))-methyltransferase [Saprospiraceae bacterium]
IEDRLVKNFFKTGDPEGIVQKDFYGNIARPWNIITKKAIEPMSEEIQRNSRARSAKLRVGEKARGKPDE